ncbi:hypothetical protein HXW87_02575 [Pseudomonas sp. Y5-11]|jgi:hypothetical protein|uniref:hypothetical protein n=1 Tax=Pseudomonas TaxID=286 RepID=UPI00103C72C5|nr:MULTISPECIES: hypothetical protein [Pseudomonas]QXE12539.1 hypothetical protein GTQ41_26960 [Pseudomonas sp. AN-B15]QXE12567.1 hypothetical protein GTQ41_27180 [Pseudomonas sp. AN-B15]ULN81084.1 hypothetical protein HXW87_02575 [Pseudomonas sp. Y5-11]
MLIVLAILMWYLQALIDTPKATQQPGQEGEGRMKKVVIKTFVNFMANATTAFCVNNLPTLTIRVSRS